MRVTFLPTQDWRYAEHDVAGQTARALARASFPQDLPCASSVATHLIVDERVWCHADALVVLMAMAGDHSKGVRVVDRAGQTLVVCLHGDKTPESVDKVRTVAEVDPQERVIALDSTTALAACERHVLFARAMGAMAAGVRLRDPHAVYLRGTLRAEADVEIDIGTIIEGLVVLAAGVRVGPHCHLRDCRVGARTQVQAYSSLDGADVGAECRVGPYGRLRPGAHLGDRVQIGNFVEVKASQIADGCRINHHSFIGDATLGARVTIGAGTITCNHDGTGPQPTVIGADVTVGSGCQLVAPVTIVAGATIGAGSTITEPVTGGGLTLARARQATIAGWTAPRSRRPGS